MDNATIDIDALVYKTMVDTLLAAQEAQRIGLNVRAIRSMDRGLTIQGVSVSCGKTLLTQIATPSALLSAVSVVQSMRRMAKIEACANGNQLLQSALERIPPAWNVIAIIDYCQKEGIDIASHLDGESGLFKWVQSSFEAGDPRDTAVQLRK